MSGSNCCFLTCIQISQEAGQVVWYSHILKNFPQFVVIYTAKGFGIINKAELDVFLEFSCLFYDPADVDNLISGSFAFYKSSLNIWKLSVLRTPQMKYLSIKINSVIQSCPPLCNPLDCSLLDSSVHGVLQAIILEWVAFLFSRGSSDPVIKPRCSVLQADSLPSEPPGVCTKSVWGKVQNSDERN